MHLILSTSFLYSANEKLPKCAFSNLKSQIWIGCGLTDCAGFVLHEGTLTLCSQGRYLIGDIHMGGKGGKCKWNGIHARFLCMLKGKHAEGYMSMQKLISTQHDTNRIHRRRIFILYYCMQERWPNMVLVSVGTHQAVSVALYIFSFTLVVSLFPSTFSLIHFSCLHSELVKDAPLLTLLVELRDWFS